MQDNHEDSELGGTSELYSLIMIMIMIILITTTTTTTTTIIIIIIMCRTMMKTANSGAEVSCIVSKRHIFLKVLSIVAFRSGFLCDLYGAKRWT